MRHEGLFLVPELAACVERDEEDVSEYFLYRRHVEALLRRYFRLSMDRAHIQSIFDVPAGRGHASHEKAYTLECAASLCIDVERCLTEELSEEELKLVALVIFLDRTFEESAQKLCLCERQVRRNYPELLNRLARRFAENELLRVPTTAPVPRKPMGRARLREMEACAAV